MEVRDVFMFTKAQLHFLFNVENLTTITISKFNNPSGQIVSLLAFGSKLEIPPAVLEKCFQVSFQSKKWKRSVEIPLADEPNLK